VEGIFMTEHVAPYNYCNYRCEKCSYLDNCRLALLELVREAELVAEGKDPQDQVVVWDEVKRNFEDTLIMLRKMAAAEGISLEEKELNDDPSSEPETLPLVEVATQFARGISSILREDISIVISDEPAFKERIGDLAWDANIVPAKLFRAMSGKREAGSEGDFLGETSLEDAFLSAGVALKALDNCLEILEEISRGALQKREELGQIVSLGNGLRASIREEFPDRIF
jgi:hypothetical protein